MWVLDKPYKALRVFFISVKNCNSSAVRVCTVELNAKREWLRRRVASLLCPVKRSDLFQSVYAAAL